MGEQWQCFDSSECSELSPQSSLWLLLNSLHCSDEEGTSKLQQSARTLNENRIVKRRTNAFILSKIIAQIIKIRQSLRSAYKTVNGVCL